MRTLFVLYAVLLFTACRSQSPQFTVTNPTAIDRENEMIVITRADLEKHIPTGESFSVVDENEQPVVTQLDDLDKDGQWDEACFLYSFRPNATVKFTTSNKNAGTNQFIAHVRLRKKINDTTFGGDILKEAMPLQNPPTDFSKQPLPLYLTEGPAWENDKVAFRLYFDTRNDKDIFGKTEPGLVVDTIGANSNNSYHKRAHWGMDILHAGNSLGAGSLAFKIKGVDSIVRLGGEDVLSETYEKIADGPLRAVFRMTYLFKLLGKTATIVDEISIWGGQYFYQSTVTTRQLPEGVELLAGMADFYENKSGHLLADKASVLYSYGKQSENHDMLGMAIIVPATTFTSVDSLPREVVKGKLVYVQKIYDSYTIAQTIADHQPAMYRFYSGWEQSDNRFASPEGFKNYITEQANSFSNPVVVKW